MVPARTLIVNGLGKKLFAGAGFPQQQNGCFAQGCRHGQTFGFLERRADPDDVIEGKTRLGAGHFVDQPSEPLDFVKNDNKALHPAVGIENRLGGANQLKDLIRCLDKYFPVDELEVRVHHPVPVS